MSARSMTGEHEPWVVASLLRDHLLSPKERKDPMLWKKVLMSHFSCGFSPAFFWFRDGTMRHTLPMPSWNALA